MPASRKPLAPLDFRTRLPALDGLRALAVTMVFLRHYGGGAHGGLLLRTVNLVRERLTIGVDLFFVLSGFLITGILYDTRHDSHYFGRFFVRRAVRIVPVLYLLFAILALLTPMLRFQWQWKQAWFLVYLGNFFANRDYSLYQLPSLLWKPAQANLGHLWSLCVEEQFYLLWPAVVWLVRNRVKLLWTCAGLSALTLGLRVLAVLCWEPELAERWLRRSMPFKLDALLFGAMLALLLRGPHADRVQRACKWIFACGLAGFVAIQVLSPSYTSPWDLTLGMTAAATLGAGLIGWALQPGSTAFRLLSLRPLLLLGKYSYGFYVFHAVWQLFWIQVLIWCVHLTGSATLAGLIALPLGFATTFLMAKLSYVHMEVRFLKLKRHFEYDLETKSHKTAFAPVYDHMEDGR